MIASPLSWLAIHAAAAVCTGLGGTGAGWALARAGEGVLAAADANGRAYLWDLIGRAHV